MSLTDPTLQPSISAKITRALVVVAAAGVTAGWCYLLATGVWRVAGWLF